MTSVASGREELIEVEGPTPTPPVKYFAWLGVGCLAFIAYVIFRWVTGPYWDNVPTGETPLPTWMKWTVRGWEIGGCVAAVYVYWRFVIKPYRRDKRLSNDGVLVIACSFLWFQDPLSQYLGYWFTYNSYFWNRGSWVNEVPGWMAGGTPGATLVEPLFWVIPFYIYGWLPWMMAGCWFMRKMQKRYPRMKVHTLILWTWLAMGLVDVIVEGTLFIPMGFFQYGGSHLAIWPDSYHKFPILNIALIGMISCGLTCLRYFQNDRGEMLTERGVRSLPISDKKKDVYRVLSMVAGTQLVLVAFNIVTGVTYGGHTAEWPEDTQRRSYFTNGICGPETDRACPGPNVPNMRGPNTIHIDPNGKLVVPKAAEDDVPTEVPFDTEPRGAFNGGFMNGGSLK